MKSFLFSACTALLFSCSPGIATFSDRDTTVDLQQYKTYAWMAPGDTTLNARRKDKLYGGYIVYAADQELAKKGMKVDTHQPDAVFMFDTKLEERVKYTQDPTLSIGVGYGGPGYYVGGSAPIAGGTIHSSAYEDGMLTISMYDTKSGKLLWTGGARGEITESTDPEALIKKALAFVFVKYPVKHKN